jgi:hypothetical protein
MQVIHYLQFAGAPSSAVLQVETATVGGAATASANVIVTVTSAAVTGSPLATNVAVTNGDTAATVAGLIYLDISLIIKLDIMVRQVKVKQ